VEETEKVISNHVARCFLFATEKDNPRCTTRRAPTPTSRFVNLFLDGFVVQADEETSDKEVKFTPPVSAPE